VTISVRQDGGDDVPEGKAYDSMDALPADLDLPE
jgi:hypothetical protein